MTVLESTKTLEEMKMDPWTLIQIRMVRLEVARCVTDSKMLRCSDDTMLAEVQLIYAGSVLNSRLIESEIKGVQMRNNEFTIYIPDPIHK